MNFDSVHDSSCTGENCSSHCLNIYVQTPTTVYEEHKAGLLIIKNFRSLTRTKHVEFWYFNKQDQMEQKKVYVGNWEQIAWLLICYQHHLTLESLEKKSWRKKKISRLVNLVLFFIWRQSLKLCSLLSLKKLAKRWKCWLVLISYATQITLCLLSWDLRGPTRNLSSEAAPSKIRISKTANSELGISGYKLAKWNLVRIIRMCMSLTSNDLLLFIRGCLP